MTAAVTQRSKEPIFVVAEQANDFRRDAALKLENRIDAAARFATAIDVIAEKHDGVAASALFSNLVEKVGERFEVAMDVADGDGRHAD